MSEPQPIKLALYSFMRPVFPINGEPGIKYFMFGRNMDDRRYVVITASPRGASYMWCEEHNRIFGLKAGCPDCGPKPADGAADEPVLPSVTACHTT